ncbi:MAG TPA: H-type lectin domain-containing protein, partial [Bacteroidales bacterium]|nr:H-type lectin domain-containing protein [Bacteroidales bacterium]
VGSDEIATGAVTTDEIFDGTIAEVDLADDAVTSVKILDGEIVDADVNTGAAIQGTKISPNFGNQTVTIGTGAGTTAGTIVLHDATASDSYTTTLQASATVLASFTLTLPADDGDANQVLTTDGSGSLSWTDPAAGWVDLTTDQTVGGGKTWSELGTFDAGLTSIGADVNLNSSSDFATNINTGSSTGTVTIGGTGNQSIAIGDNASGTKIITIGNNTGATGVTVKYGSGGATINGGTAAASTAGANLSLTAQSSGAGGNDAGGDIILTPGENTGTGTQGRIIIQDGHIKSTQTNPPSYLSSYGNGSLSNATDIAGRIDVTIAGAPGTATVTFDKPYTTPPVVILSYGNTNTARYLYTDRVYVTSTTTSFTLNFSASTNPGARIYYYSVIETQ